MSGPRGKGRGAIRWVRRLIWSAIELHRLISLGLVLAAPAISFIASKVSEWYWVATVLVSQLILAAMTWYVGDSRAKTLEVERREASVEMQVALSDGLEPVAQSLAKLARMGRPQRRLQRSGLVQAVLAAAVGLGPEGSRPRACYFTLDGEPGPRRLTHHEYAGRAVAAKAEFAEGTVAGNAALAMVDDNAFLYCDDVDDNPPPGWEPNERGEYRCFISVTVSAGPKRYGMLTLDAVEAGALTGEDRQVLQVLGHLLGVVEALSG